MAFTLRDYDFIILAMLSKKSLFYYFRKILPFILIFVSSVLPFAIYFRDGIPTGDDMIWHLTYMYDLYYGFKNGFSGMTTSHIISSYYGENIYLFYGPFAHYLTVIFALMFEWAGATIITSMKIVTVISVFVSGIFIYLLAKQITKSSQISTLFGIAFCFFPYRLVDFLYRAAYCEGIAVGLIPIVFYGLYRILHEKSPRVSPYICLVIGMSCLILCHPLTAMMTAIVAVVYIVANTMKLVKILRQWQNWVYLSISVLLIFGFVSFYFFPMLFASTSGYYRLTNPILMGTNMLALIKAQEANWGYCGILNFDWLAKVVGTWGWKATNDSALSWALSLAFFVISCVGTIIADYFLRQNRKLSPWRPLFCFLTTFLLSFIYLAWERPEIFCALGVFYLAYLYVTFDFVDPCDELPTRFNVRKTFTNPDIYMAVGIIVACALLLGTTWAWHIAPSILYEIQFPFRLYAIIGFMAYFLAMPLASWARGKRTAILSLAFISSLLLVIDQAPVDKRMAWANNGNTIYTVVDKNLTSSVNSVGVENEYALNVFYDFNYKSEYSNSLYYKVRDQLNSGSTFPRGSTYLTPALLDGHGSVSVVSVNTPKAVFTINVSSDQAYVQIPQFYYDGYAITLASSTGSVSTENGENVDGLVAFKMVKGTYTVNVDFVGSKAYKIGQVAFYVSIPATISLGCLGIFFRKKEEKKKVLENSSSKA